MAPDPDPHPDALTRRLRELALDAGFDLAGAARLRASDHARFYQEWLEHGYHGQMDYLARPDAVERRLAADRAWPALKSALVVGHEYYVEDGAVRDRDSEPAGDAVRVNTGRPFFSKDAGNPDSERPAGAGSSAPPDTRAAASPGPLQGPRPDSGIIARYARGRDYHKVVKKKLFGVLRALESELGRALPEARVYVDTGPVLERELARRAGLGWFGRNTMLIHPRRGSYFFLGVLLLPLELGGDDDVVADHCGTCHACLDACPTGALLGRDADGAPIMDATRCISYLTIEHRGPIPEELRPLMGNRVYGCDICQEVCPFNRRFAEETAEPGYAARGPAERPHGVEPMASDAWHPGTDSPSLIELMAMDEAAWESFSRGSAVRRAGRSGFLRNVAVALGNWASPEAVPVLVSALADSTPLVRAHSAWALGRVGSSEAVEALRSGLESEEDPFVRDELEAALERAPRAT